MVRYLLLTCGFLLFGSAIFGQTALTGKVIEEDTGDPVIFGNVAIYKNDVLITGVQTGFDGIYSFNPIDPGTYDVEVSYVGFPSKRITGVVVYAEKSNTLNVSLTEGIDLTEVVVIGYEVPLIEQDNTVQGQTLTSDEIRRRPVRGVNALAASTAGVTSSDEGEALSFRGSRTNATNYYLDGIRISGRSIPQQDIDQLQVITGGVPAIYGDVTGGIISLTSKGPSSKFSGGIEVETSQIFDNYNYTLGAINLSGPIIKKKTGESILGYRISAQYLTQDDDDAPSLDRYLVKDDVLANLQANPLTQVVDPNSGNITFVPTATFLTADDWNTIDYNPYENRENLDLTAKLDLKVNDAIDFTITGTYNDESDQFTPTTNPDDAFLPGGDGSWRIFNNYTNPIETDKRFRANMRFRHRIGAGSNLRSEEGANASTKAALIQNASYTIQAGYELNNTEVGDPRHGDDFFGYGYVGKFDNGYVPTILGARIDSANVFVGQVDWSERFNVNGENPFVASGNNPILGTYVNQLLDANTNPILSLEALDVVNGRVSGPLTNVYNFYSNVGSVYNRYNKAEDETITANINGSFELVPASGGRHNVQFGFLYEQRKNRNYRINPFELWDLADDLANTHLNGVGLDFTNQVGNQDFVFEDSTYNVAVFAPLPNDPTTTNFYKRIREVTGQELYEFVNVQGLDPSDLSLDMFTASELLNQNITRYSGYDYLGNKIDNVTFDDFFTATDDSGLIRTFPVAAFEPNYASVFVQDKFKYKDIIFRLGVRIDRFDANTKVLKDPYSLYEIVTASDFHTEITTVDPITGETVTGIRGGNRPGNIGDDFAVYTTDNTSNDVQAYRDGDIWYKPDGTQVNNGADIFGTTPVNPRLTNPNADIQDVGFDTDLSFEDYKPQINVMPRLAFSFPISDEANFFAHYDVLVQRPPSNSFVNPARYYYWNQTGLRNNSNLRPEKTIDYEIGFQQKISNSSAIKLTAYYKELRDMIQARFYFQIPTLGEYETFDNLDFGTVKGFSASYDLRRTGNIQLNIAYTLQFADGTGSDSESSRNTGTKSIVRVLSP
ncbi:MAG: outer membrane receptor protein involved in Fe transport, partial [Saprospiraceae bacterium]